MGYICENNVTDISHNAMNPLPPSPPPCLCRAVQLRCLPVLLDSHMLSFKCVLVNVYQTFLMAALKYLAYITALPQWSKRHGYKPAKLDRRLVLHFYSECTFRLLVEIDRNGRSALSATWCLHSWMFQGMSLHSLILNFSCMS